MKFKLIFTVLFIHISFSGFSQNKEIDDLSLRMKQAKQDTVKARLYIDIAVSYQQINPDSAIYFLKKSLSITKSKNEKSRNLHAQALVYLGWIYFLYKSEYDSCMFFTNRAQSMFKHLIKSSNKTIVNYAKKGMSGCYNNLGNIYNDQGDLEKAIEYYLKSLKLCEEANDKMGMSSAYTNIGGIYDFQESYDKALEYYLKSLHIDEQVSDKKGISADYLNIGGVYHGQQLFDKAKEYYEKALKLKEEIGDLKGMSQCYNNLGGMYYLNGDYTKTIEYLTKSLKIRERLNDKNGIAFLYANITGLYITIADSLKANNQNYKKEIAKTIEFGTKSFDLASEINAIPTINDVSAYLKDAYKMMGNTTKSLEFAEIYIATKDSMFGEEKTKALAEMETKYQSEKKQLEIEKLGKQKELDNQTIIAKTAENKKQRILIISFVAGFVLILIFSVLLYRLFLQKKRANVLLAKQNAEIRQQKEEISTQRDEIEAQRDEIEAQRDLVTEQKNHIEEIHKEVTDSINYAKRIQEAVLPISDSARSVLGEHFVLFKPKDIVSGDFYWTTKKDKLLYVAVADCTGHGVPGAFMSMLGISFLNEIIQKHEINKANQILNNLREEIIHALQQKGVQGEQKDGMDISLLIINTDTNETQWAGANNPLYIVSKSESEKLKEKNVKLSTIDFQLYELKGNKMPIAIYPELNDFTNHEMVLHKGDSLYLFTDGFADQFGGPSGRKFMYKQLKEILLKNSYKTMAEQKEMLENEFMKWKGMHEQIDDVTILGLKV